MTRAEYEATYGGDPERATNFGRALLEGGSGIMSALELAFNPAPRIARQITGIDSELPSEQLDDLRRDVFGDAVAKDETQGDLNAIARMLPSVVIPGGSLGGRVVSAASAGIFGERAKRAGLPEIPFQILGGAAPSLFSSAVRGASRGVFGRPLAEQADEITAKAIPNIDEIAQKVSVAKKTPYSGEMRTAEIARDPNLARLTRSIELDDTVRNAQGKAAKDIGREMDEARDLIRRRELVKDLGIERTPEEAGGIVRAALLEGEKNVSGKVSAAANLAKSESGLFDLYPVKKKLADSMIAARNAGQVVDDASLSVMDAFKKKIPKNVTVEQFLNTRQNIGSALGDVKTGQLGPAEKNAKRLLSALYSDLKKLPANSAVPKETVRAIERMDDLRKLQGNLYGVGATQQILKPASEFGGFRLVDSKVLGKAIETPEAARQVFNGIKQKSAAGLPPSEFGRARESIQSALTMDLIDRSTSMQTGTLLSSTFSKNWRNIRNAAKEVLSPDQIKAVNAVRADLLSRNRLDQYSISASRGGSQTVELYQGVKQIRDVALDFLKGLPWVGRAFEALGGSRVEKLESLVNENLIGIAFDPNFAKAFAEKATAQFAKSAGIALAGRIAAQISAGMSDEERLQGESSTAAQPAMPAPQPAMSANVPAATPASTPAATPAATPAPQLASAANSPISDALLDALRKVESYDGKYLVSPAGALGPYQFMPRTARAYGLKDPMDETTSRIAARQYLEDELRALGDLKLAAAAYNAGRPAVLDAIRKAKSRDFEEVKKFLPEETQLYVPKIWSLLA
jgi:soluble lytic murein transglycosylase-like protein